MGILASGDGPGAGRPAGQIDQIGDLGHLGPFPHVAAIGGDGREPVALGDAQHGHGHRLGQRVPDTKANAPGLAGSQELVRAAGRVGPSDDLMIVRADRQLGQGGVEHLNMIGRGARTGVARPQLGGQRLPGGIQIGHQRIEAEPLLVSGRRALLVIGVRVDQGAVQIDDIEPRVHARRPRPPASRGPSRSDPGQGGVIDRRQRPPRRRHRRHLTEQLRLSQKNPKIRQRRRPISHRDRQIHQHPAPIMTPPPLLGRRHRLRQPLTQPQVISQVTQQPSPRMRHHTLATSSHRQPRS
jgi:hypothetical protein